MSSNRRKQNVNKEQAQAESEQPILDPEAEWMTPGEIGRAIGHTDQTIRNWIKAGLLKYQRMPSGLMKVKRADVESLLRASALEKSVQ